MRSTHTVAILTIPREAYNAIFTAFVNADPRQLQERLMKDGAIDLNGVALKADS